MIAKINKTGIISDTIQKFDGEKYLTMNDLGLDAATDIPETLSNVIDAQALAEAAALNAIEAKEDAIENVETLVEEATVSIQEVVSDIKNETFTAQALSETAALNAIEAKITAEAAKNTIEASINEAIEIGQTIQETADEITAQAVEEATALAVNAKNLAEVAAVNALEAERNVQARANEIVEEATSQAVNAKNLSETAAVNALEAERNAQVIKEELADFAESIKNNSRTVGEQWITFDGTIPEGGVAFLGQYIDYNIYKKLYEWAIAHNRVISEAEYEEYLVSNGGSCPYYSELTGNEMFRVPIFNGYLKVSETEEGSAKYIAEGLPNITGTFTGRPHQNGNLNYGGSLNNEVSGAFSFAIQGGAANAAGATESSTVIKSDKMTFDASNSNAIYGNSVHVTPETNTVLVGVWATSGGTKTIDVSVDELAEKVQDLKNQWMGSVAHVVGEQWITFDGTIPDGGVPFHGQSLKIAVYSSLYQWAIDNNRIISDAEWQNIKTENNGNVSYYAQIDNNTFRMPLFSGYFKASLAGGSYIKEGLPNITGSFQYHVWGDGRNGAFSDGGSTLKRAGTGNDANAGDAKTKFDASLSNPIYGNSEHVTPETNTVIVGAWAFNTYQNTTDLDIADIRNALSVANTYDSMPLLMSHWDKKGFVSPGWVKADAYWLSGDQYISAYNKILEKFNNGDEDVTEETYTNSETTINPDKFLIDTNTKMFRLPFVNGEKVVVKKKGDDISKEWYELFADGHLIQGNEFYNNATVANVITLPISFKNTNYFITKQNGITTDYYDSIHNRYASVSSLTTTSFVSWTYNADGINRFRWSAEGESNIIPPSQYTENIALYFKLGNVFINEDQIDATAISNKVDEIRNSWVNTIRVIETYNDGTSWYRKYSDGFIEQFGQLSITSSVSTKSFLLPFTNKPNVILSRESGRNGASYDNEMYPQSISTTNFTYKMNISDVRAATWYACGY